MKRPERRLARPVYEALPYVYILGGLAALVASYAWTSGVVSGLIGIPGFVAFLGGMVLLLRRRDYRRMRQQYGQPDALSDQTSTDHKQL